MIGHLKYACLHSWNAAELQTHNKRCGALHFEDSSTVMFFMCQKSKLCLHLPFVQGSHVGPFHIIGACATWKGYCISLKFASKWKVWAIGLYISHLYRWHCSKHGYFLKKFNSHLSVAVQQISIWWNYWYLMPLLSNIITIHRIGAKHLLMTSYLAAHKWNHRSHWPHHLPISCSTSLGSKSRPKI